MSFIPTTILSRMRSSLRVPNSQYSARQYKSVKKLSTDSPSCWLLRLNLARSNIRFSLPRNELQTCLSPSCTTLLLQLSVRMTLRCRQLLRPSNKSKYSLGSRRPFGRVQSLFEIVRNAWSKGTILRVWSWTSQVVELGNSVWVSVEPWAAVQLRQLVLVRLIVQGELFNYMRLFSFNCGLVCTLISHISVLSDSSSV